MTLTTSNQTYTNGIMDTLKPQQQDISNRGPTISLAPSLQEALYDRQLFLESELTVLAETVPRKEFLRKALSTCSAISTASSAARCHQTAHSDAMLHLFREIGSGSFGRVFEHIGEPRIIKIAKHGDERAMTSLWNDFEKHVSVFNSFEACGATHSSVPRAISFIGKENKFWTSNERHFPDTDMKPGYGIFAERILPLPLPIRINLIREYCPPKYRAAALSLRSNKDCLVRLYLGQTSSARTKGALAFSLRNFCLRLDQMKDLKLSIYAFACAMAEALAIMHWKAEVDAKDVEFVLGSQPANEPSSAPCQFEDSVLDQDLEPEGFDLAFFHRVVHMWVLDFNQVGSMSMDEAGVDKAVTAFFLNDPYFPRPNFPELWTYFARKYRDYSRKALMARRDGGLRELGPLPAMFIKRVEKEFTVREEKKAAAEARLEKERF